MHTEATTSSRPLPTPPKALVATTLIAAAAVAGMILVFSAMVMPALDDTPDPVAIESMQAMNERAGPLFLLPWGVAALGSMVLIGWILSNGGVKQFPFAFSAAVLYLVGVIFLTGAINIPLNDELAEASTTDSALWSDFVSEWSIANHIRGLAALAASVLLALTLWRPH
jgi:uncharacterized membrane protein